MGNQLCCQETTSLQRKQQLRVDHLSQNVTESVKPQKIVSSIHIPELQPNIHALLNQYKPFQQQFQSQSDIKRAVFGKDIYEGPLDLIGRPTKIGKMYKSNGAYFIGKFSAGKAQGPCFYVMKDGSFYQGDMKDNYADCQNGRYVSQTIQYQGGFKNNLFHGKGSQKLLKQFYTFTGDYDQGNKKNGRMCWGNKVNQYIYEGSFNENGQFTGKGKFIDPQGVYQGQFQNGQKHGYGLYNYITQIRYEGWYSHNKKQGQGKLYNNDNTIAYKGVFKNGMPNGKGIATSKNGTQFQTQWKDGIDIRLL